MPHGRLRAVDGDRTLMSSDATAVHIVLVLITVSGYVLTLALLPVVLLTKKQWSASTVAWAMAIMTMPYLGAILFLVFGINRVDRRVRGRQAAAMQLSTRWPPLSAELHLANDRLNETQRQLLRLAERTGGTKATLGNRITLFPQTTEAFAAIEAALRNARESIHLEYYIWQPDRIGTRLRDILIERALAGVKVRFLYDTLGSIRLTHRFLEPMRTAQIQVAPFVPGRTLRERWSINLRSHRKIILVDGKIGMTGGMNIGDEYLGKDPHFGYWRDTHLQLEGPTVRQLQDVFATDWYYATGEDLSPGEHCPLAVEPGLVDAQILAGGPDEVESVFHAMMFGAISVAKRTVTIATSYFVPTPALVTALQTAAYRGVRTRILVSGPVTYWATYHAGRSFYEELLAAGVEIFEYRRGQQHAKTLTVDGGWALVGTPNFDARSFYLNFEVGVALYDANLAEQLDRQFDADLADAVRIDPHIWQQRTVGEKLIENGCRLFAPVL